MFLVEALVTERDGEGGTIIRILEEILVIRQLMIELNSWHHHVHDSSNRLNMQLLDKPCILWQLLSHLLSEDLSSLESLGGVEVLESSPDVLAIEEFELLFVVLCRTLRHFL